MPHTVMEGQGKAGRREREELGYVGEKPVKEGEEYDVSIEEVGARGDGFARVQNFVIFVQGSQKGEKLRVRVKSVHSKFAIAEKVGAAPTGGTDATTTA